jgi:hypothetical protein
MRQDIVDVFHHHVDVKVQHPVDRIRVGIDQVAADINTGIGVQDVEFGQPSPGSATSASRSSSRQADR